MPTIAALTKNDFKTLGMDKIIDANYLKLVLFIYHPFTFCPTISYVIAAVLNISIVNYCL